MLGTVETGGSFAPSHLSRSSTSLPADKADRPLVLIVDDDEGIRSAIYELLLSVGIDAQTFGSTQALLQAELPDRPGCLILDVRMPGASGLDLQQHLASHGNTRPVIFLTGHGDIAMTVQAMKAGAIDFLTKPVRDQTLLDAVSAGIEKDVSQRAAAQLTRKYSDRYARLTPREREVLREVAKGRLNKQIAFDLGISEITVKLHRGNLTRKLQATSIGQLIRIWESLPEDIRREQPLYTKG